MWQKEEMALKLRRQILRMRYKKMAMCIRITSRNSIQTRIHDNSAIRADQKILFNFLQTIRTTCRTHKRKKIKR
jgi:hypothetical protein